MLIGRHSSDYNKGFGLDTERVKRFILSTQKEKVENTACFSSPSEERKFFSRLSAALLYYSQEKTDSIDVYVSRNGLPIMTMELKNHYFEKSYKRMDALVSTEATDPVKKQVLDSLGNKFITAEAVKAGADFGFARRTVMYMLKDFCQRNFIIKDKQGNYEKVQK